MSKYKYTIVMDYGLEVVEIKDYGISYYMDFIENNDKYYALHDMLTNKRIIIDKKRIQHIIFEEIGGI
jgi:hypothetical protein